MIFCISRKNLLKLDYMDREKYIESNILNSCTSLGKYCYLLGSGYYFLSLLDYFVTPSNFQDFLTL